MIPIHKITGRLGNQMFNYAFMLNYALTHGIKDSYFPQHMEWFSESADYVRAIYGQDIGEIDMVGIHVRRDDYLDKNRIQYALPLEYYQEAMDYFKGEKFLIFSDDIEWCKQQEIFKGCEFSEGKTEIEDLNLFASCKGHIIANSTFSWWGAYLSPLHPKNTVIAPFKWDKDGKLFSMPEHWTLI